MSNLFDAYQQMADSLQEAGVSLSGDKTYTKEAADIQSAYEKSQRLAGSDRNDDNNQSTSTIKYYDNDKDESDSLSISNENFNAPLKDSDGKIIGNVDLSDKKVFDLYSNEEGLYEGLKLSFTDKKDPVPIGPFMYEKTPTGKKGLTFKIGKGKAYMDADIDLLKSDAPIAANTGFVLDFAEGGSLPNTKPMQMEMDLILSETKDPVSGNTAPLGATPEEVRDDVPINASPNEFMINAATRRYYGTEFFEELQKSAAEGWKRIRDGEESYFRDDELEVEDDEKGQDKPINMQEGGAVPKPVGGGFGSYGGTGSIFTGFESRTFINDTTGQTIIIFFFNGRPMSRIPEGFREKAATPVEEQAQKTQQDDDNDNNNLQPDPDPTFRNTPVKNWTTDMYKNYSDFYQLKADAGNLTPAERVLVGLVGGAIGGPAGSVFLTKVALEENKKIAKGVVNNVMELVNNNKNPDGTNLNTATLEILNKARVNANYNIMNIGNKGLLGFEKKGASALDPNSDAAQAILNQQNTIVDKAFLLDPDKKSDIFKPGAFLGKDDNDDDPPFSERFFAGAFYGGSSEAESALIESDLSDDEFFDQFEPDVTARTNIGNVGSAGSDKDDDDKDSGCVIATHGISTGGFSRLDKAKAELWCERTYHGKWYGEAFRRGYRHAGNIAIEKGKAAEHYQEFKDFVSYGRGLKKGVKPALNYYLRTVQFFLTGLFVK